jgi:hypothetical protein
MKDPKPSLTKDQNPHKRTWQSAARNHSWNEGMGLPWEVTTLDASQDQYYAMCLVPQNYASASRTIIRFIFIFT